MTLRKVINISVLTALLANKKPPIGGFLLSQA